MKLLARSLALVLVAVFASASIALAAMPKLGGTYAGHTFKQFPVRITVAPKRVRKGVYKGTFSYCNIKVGILIVHGRFGVKATENAFSQKILLFKAHGSFISSKLAQGRIDEDFSSSCDGLPGDFSATLK